MFGKHWIARTALLSIGFLFISAIAIINYDLSNRDRAERAANYQSEHSDYSFDCKGIAPASERTACLANARRAEQQRIYTHADLRAQQDMAVWTLGMFWAAAFGVALTLAALMAIISTLYQTKRAADAAHDTVIETRDIGRAQNRPHLGAIGATFYSSPRGLICKFKTKNYGPTAAIDVSIKARIISEVNIIDHACHTVCPFVNMSDVIETFWGTISPKEQIQGEICWAFFNMGEHHFKNIIKEGGPIKIVVFIRWKNVFCETDRVMAMFTETAHQRLDNGDPVGGVYGNEGGIEGFTRSGDLSIRHRMTDTQADHKEKFAYMLE